METNQKEWTLVKANNEDVKLLCKHSALTWEGMDISDDNLDAIVAFFKESTPQVKLPIKFWYASGELFNSMYELTGNNAYPDDIHILMIDLDNWDSLEALLVVRFQCGARWLDDIVANNEINERSEDEEE